MHIKKKFDQNNFLNSFRKLFSKKKINLHEPKFNSADQFHLLKCLKSTMVSTAGAYVSKFENEIKKFTKSKHAIAVLNGTIGIELCLRFLGIKNNDEVLLPAMTFVAPASAILNIGAIPHFVAIRRYDLGVDIELLEKYLLKNTIMRKGKCFNLKTKRYITAIIPVHVFGHPCDLDGVMKISKKFKLKVIEDAADGIGSFYKKKHVGTIADLGVLSFNGNKTITTGCGGMILTNNNSLARTIKHRIATAKIFHPFKYEHDQHGFNAKLPALNASIGYSQMLRIKKILLQKRMLFSKYKSFFKKIDFIEIMTEPKNCSSNFWLQTVFINQKKTSTRDRILKELIKRKINARAGWTLIPLLNPYKKYPKMNMKISKIIAEKVINIPSSYY